MKTFKEYLTESKKVYQFKIKVADELPENFQDNLKAKLGRAGVAKLEKVKTTPIQANPLDFPNHPNTEVSIFDLVCEYPITSPEIANDIMALGIAQSCFRVNGAGEETECHNAATDEPSGEAVLEKDIAKDDVKIKHKDWFGDDFNKGFLKDLSKAAKERKKEGQGAEYKLDKIKQDKAGSSSPMSKISNPDPIKG